MGKFLKKKYLVPVLILIGGFIIMRGLMASRKPPMRELTEYNGALVRIMDAVESDHQIIIEGTGTVNPRYQFNLTSQVSGIVEWMASNLLAGGQFNKGDTLLKIEQSDYLLAVQQAEASVAQAQYKMDLEKASAEIASEEWELMNSESGDKTQPDPLVLREPQMRQAEAALLSAKASLDLARLNLKRTALTAPYNCRVRSISVSPGQLINASTPVASLYATDVAEIDVSLQMSDLSRIQIPGAKARVILDTGNDTYEWTGYVHRGVGVLDEIGRLTRVVVRIDSPFKARSADKPDLNIGSFVKVEIAGQTLEHVVAVPRAALREKSTVWVANHENSLEIRGVSVQWMTPEEALIDSGLAPGDRIVLTSLSGVSEGMKLRPLTEEDL